MTPAKEIFDELYARYNRREFIHPDPLEFLYHYEDVRDREVVGLVASSLAYGRVAQILKSVASVFERIPCSPRVFLADASKESLIATFSGFKHRFTTDKELAMMLFGVKRAIKQYGSLEACFSSCLDDGDDTILPALSAFVKELTAGSEAWCNSLLPLPARGSACKRLHLFLRWMVRKDEVDPGGWSAVPPSKLIIPLDTHMHRICRVLKLTKRSRADMRTAIGITKTFKTIAPHDPVKYDFALTRLGIRDDTDLDLEIERLRNGG